MPKVSVMIVSFNHEAFIAEAVTSAARQDWDDLEVVVADDASTDRTPALLRELAAQYPGRVRLILNERNLGITGNCNVAFTACTGELVAFLGGDDVMLPGKISHQARFMLGDPGCALSFHDVEVFGDGPARLFSAGHPPHEGDAATLVRHGTFAAALSMMIRRRPGLRFDDRIPVASDWLFWIDAAEGGTVRDAGGVWARYRRHPGNVTNDGRGVLEERLLTLRIAQERHPRLARACKEGRARLFAEAAFAAAGARRPVKAGISLLRAAAASPGGALASVSELLKHRAAMRPDRRTGEELG